MNESSNRPEDHRRDIIVIGASAGGLEPLKALLATLPSTLKAAVFVVLHIGATSYLTELLAQVSSLPVQRASRGARIAFGQVYVAVPRLHLLLHSDHILLRRGPRENLARPAIDPLFRSAAATFGGRVIGVILSGVLNDGAAGMRAVKQCGGTTIVQHPADAAYPEMPLSALRHCDVDHVVPAREISGRLSDLVRQPARPTPPIPFSIRLEAGIAAQELVGMEIEDKLGEPSRFTCPECHGALWEIADGNLLRYRCHVGHAFTAESMLSAQGAQTEELLWSLMRAHQERAALTRRMAEQESTQGRSNLASQLRDRAAGYDEDARVIQGLLQDTASGPEADEEADGSS